MAHFAELDDNNIVQRVIVVSNKNTSDANGVEDENIGIAFCKKLYGEGTNWKQCSYNMKIRKCLPGTGYLYSEEHDAFVHPQPYPSWSLNEYADWMPPLPKPELTEEQVRLGYRYDWNERDYQRDTSDPKTEGWVLFTPQVITIDTQPTDVSVSVGSSVAFTATATVNRGYFGYYLEKWIEDEMYEIVGDVQENDPNNEELTVNATCYTGITTTGDNNTRYRIAFAPRDNGVPAFTTSVTLTVEE